MKPVLPAIATTAAAAVAACLFAVTTAGATLAVLAAPPKPATRDQYLSFAMTHAVYPVPREKTVPGRSAPCLRKVPFHRR